MNKEILIDENRVLKLKNLLIYSVDVGSLSQEDGLDKKAKFFDDYIKNHGLTSFGPTILGTTITGGDEPKMFVKFMRQIRDNHSPLPPFALEKEFKSPLCLYASFDGKEQDMGIANSKMQAYAYEHNMFLDTVSYTVYVSRQQDNVKADIFIPVLGSEQE